jgi:hypothetical protein
MRNISSGISRRLHHHMVVMMLLALVVSCGPLPTTNRPLRPTPTQSSPSATPADAGAFQLDSTPVFVARALYCTGKTRFAPPGHKGTKHIIPCI